MEKVPYALVVGTPMYLMLKISGRDIAFATKVVSYILGDATVT